MVVKMPRLPNISILFKLYAIVALFATVTVMLAVVAVEGARRQAQSTSDFEAALQSAQTVERMNSLVYAVTMESRGLYMAQDATAVAERARQMLRYNNELLKLTGAWQGAALPEQAEIFRALPDQIRQFYENRV